MVNRRSLLLNLWFRREIPLTLTRCGDFDPTRRSMSLHPLNDLEFGGTT